MLLLAPAAAFLGVRTCTAAAALLSFTDLTLAFVPPLAGSSRTWWNEEDARRARTRARLPAEVRPTRRAPTCSVRAKRLAGGESSDGVGRQQTDTGGEGGGGGDAAASRKRSGGGKRRKRSKKSLQQRLNEMRLDFSLGDREPYVAGAPPRIPPAPESPPGGTPSQAAAPAALAGGGTMPAKSGRQALYSNYRRRRRPLNASCMPKNQRPQGCGPLLPPIGTGGKQVVVVDHVAPELEKIRHVSEYKSDLPCVQTGTCPVPVFRCSKGHVWEPNGTPVCFYCPICADTRITTRMKRKRDLEAMQEIARGKGGECIAEEYLGIDEKIAFRCGDGHEWLTSPSNLVYKNTWCPKCAALRSVERKKLTLADMHQTARQFGGVFLSPEYKGAAVKHEWRCKRGHTFWNTPNNVRRAEGGRRVATFCKICTSMDRRILKAAVLGGLDKDDAKSTLDQLNAVGAMPIRRHFLKKRATGKSTLAAQRRKMIRMNNRSSSGSPANTTSNISSSGEAPVR
ncbi:unnamed protein product [Ectocarpus sp. 6 AP-2014]